jgi:hypothetical protein
MTFPLSQPIVLNNGPNPYTTQCSEGLTTPIPQPLNVGDTLFVLYTGATYGGAHTGYTVKTALGNSLTLVKDVKGLPNSAGGSINQSQELALWMGVVTVAGQDSVIAKWQGGDLDSQAVAVIVAKGAFKLLGSDGVAQNDVQFKNGSGNNVLTSRSGAGIPVTPEQLPCWLLGFCTNISEISDTQNYSPQPGDRMVMLLTGWPFPVVNQQNLPNLLIAAQYLASATAGLQTYFSTLVPGEYWQTIAVALEPPPVVVPNTNWDLTTAQLAELNAGAPVIGTFPNDIAAGTNLTLVPPSQAANVPASPTNVEAT